jgi:uncharacterized protein (DUF342 family)
MESIDPAKVSPEAALEAEARGEGVDNVVLPPITLAVSDDCMRVHLSSKFAEDDLAPLVKALEIEMKRRGFFQVPPRAELEGRLARALEGGAGIDELLIMCGQPPTEPCDAWIEWTRDFFSADFVVDEATGQMDYRRRKGNPAIGEGEVIAKLHRHQEGSPGRDVFGKTVRPRQAKRVSLRAGKNAEREICPEMDLYRARVTGRVRLSGTTLSVDQVMVVEGSVGLETGNIDHPDSVLIKGDVLVGSLVAAGGDIEIRGSVEPADIRAGGNLIVGGGITGAEDKRIRAVGGLQAKFIQEADIEVGQDVVVGSGLIHANVKCRGALKVESGRVIGGRCVALQGMILGEAGSPGLVPTRLFAGVDFCLPTVLKPRNKRMKELQANLDEIDEQLKPLHQRRNSLTPEEKAVAFDLVGKRREFEEKMAETRREVESLAAASKRRAREKIVVLKRLHPEVHFHIGEKGRLHMKESFAGPLRAVLEGERVKLREEFDEDRAESGSVLLGGAGEMEMPLGDEDLMTIDDNGNDDTRL